MKKRSAQRRRTDRSSARWLGPLLAAGALLLVAVIALARRAAAPALPATETPVVYTSSGGGEIHYPDVARIDPAGAKVAYDAGSALFVDVRGRDQYDSEHISGAISLPLDELEARQGELPREARIITYCT